VSAQSSLGQHLPDHHRLNKQFRDVGTSIARIHHYELHEDGRPLPNVLGKPHELHAYPRSVRCVKFVPCEAYILGNGIRLALHHVQLAGHNATLLAMYIPRKNSAQNLGEGCHDEPFVKGGDPILDYSGRTLALVLA
jgi:hypothetical protein